MGRTQRRVAYAVLLAAFVMAPPDAAAQGERTFRWQEVKTVCDFGRQPGLDQVPFQNGTYQIPAEQFNAARRCNLVIRWRNFGSAFDTAEPGIDAALIRSGGQRLARAIRQGPSTDLQVSVPLRDLPFGSTAFQATLRVRRPSGEIRTSDPLFRAFGRSLAESAASPPRIEAFRILQPGTRRVLSGSGIQATDPMVQLDLQVTGAQPTHIEITENSRHVTRVPYAPTTGQYGGVQMYTLRDQQPGRKSLTVKLLSGAAESNVRTGTFDFARLVSHLADPSTVLDFARSQGFRHRVVYNSAEREASCVIAPKRLHHQPGARNVHIRGLRRA